MSRKPYKRGDHYRNFQSVKTDAKLLRTMHDAEINRQGFETENLRYQSAAGTYFTAHIETESAFNAYIVYLAFFMGLTRDASADVDDIDDTDSVPSICSFAYKALVLFGTDDYRLIFATIDNLLLNTEGEMIRSIIQLFSSLSIPTYHSNIDLSLWQEWIRYENTKRAFFAFAIADQIVALTGPCSGYVLQLTKNFPKIKNTKTNIVYIHTKKEDPTQLAYAIKMSETTLLTGTFDAQAIGLALFSEFTQLFQSAAISTSPTGHIASEINLDDKIKIFNYLQRQHHDIALPRKKEFQDIEIAVATIKYQRFHEMPELAHLCSLYDLPEKTFDRCLDVYEQCKQNDNLPNIIVNGADIGPDWKGFFLVKLPADDCRALILGEITDCCQSIEKPGEQCVLDGWTREDNGFYVLLEYQKSTNNPQLTSEELISLLFRKGGINYNAFKIVGQGYAWKSQLGNIVFDSWENRRPESHDIIAEKLLLAFANCVIQHGDQSVFRVCIGIGGKTPIRLIGNASSSQLDAITQGYHYADSKTQSVLAQRFEVTQWQAIITKSICAIEELPGTHQYRLVNIAPLSMAYPAMLDAVYQHKTDYVYRLLLDKLNNGDDQLLSETVNQLTALFAHVGYVMMNKVVTMMASYLSLIDTLGLSTTEVTNLFLISARLMSASQDQQIETAIALAMVQMKHFLKQAPERVAFDSATHFEKYCNYFIDAFRQFLCLTFMTHERSIIYLSFCSPSVSINAHAARVSIMDGHHIPLHQLQLEYASVISFNISDEQFITLLKRAPFSALEKTVHDFSLNRTEKRKLLYYAGRCDIDHLEIDHPILVYLSRSTFHIEEYTAIQKIAALGIPLPTDFMKTQRHHSFKFFNWMAIQLDLLISQGVAINADIIGLLTKQREDGSVLFTRINAFVLLLLNCQKNAIPITDILHPLFHFTLKRVQDEKNREAINNRIFPFMLEAHQRSQLNERLVGSLQSFMLGTSSIPMSSTTLTVFSHKNPPLQTTDEGVDFSPEDLSAVTNNQPLMSRL